MRRTPRVLSVAVLGGLIAGTAAAAGSAAAVPKTRQPGGVAVFAACEPTGTTLGAPADAVDAGATADGRNVSWSVDGSCKAATGGEGGGRSAGFALPPDGSENETSQDASGDEVPQTPSPEDVPQDPVLTHDPSPDEASQDASHGQAAQDPSRQEGARDPSRDQGSGNPSRQEGARDPSRDAVSRDPGRSCTRRSDGSCEDAVIQPGVQAGADGTFSASAPAFVAGGVLIAAGFGASARRAWRRRRAAG
ncbi:hypothetical protein ABZV31_04060 [Streptomyces sp. NPDC005202]|uniref:hypothetical protein n=1 Tax=Streptomyces sp. NPDC005202 TaxID=3157021 RepID=UPI0033B99F22